MLTELRPALEIPERFSSLAEQVKAQLERAPLVLSKAELLDVSRNSFILAFSHNGQAGVAKLPRPEGTVSPADQRKRDYDNLRSNLANYIPPTSFVRTPPHNDRQPESSLVAQPRIFGSTLSRISWEELRDHPKVVTGLKNLTLRSFLMFRSCLMLPDLYGMYPSPPTIKRILMKNSQNIMIDIDHEGVFLVDTDCHPDFFSLTHAAINQKAKIGGRLAGMGLFYLQLMSLRAGYENRTRFSTLGR